MLTLVRERLSHFLNKCCIFMANYVWNDSCTGYVTGNRCFWNGCYRAGTGGRSLGRGQWNSSGHAISDDVMLQWTLEHRAFAHDSSVKSGESIIETQRLFRHRFNIGLHGNIPSRNAILRWVTSFKQGKRQWRRNHLVLSQLHEPWRTWKEWERPSCGVQPVLLGETLSNWERAKAR